MLVVVSFNLRGAISSVPPVLSDIENTLGLGGAAAGALTTVPVLCMAFFAPIATRVTNRLGADRTVGWALAVLALGGVVRVGGNHVAILYVGTLLVGVGIASANSLMPAVISSRYGERSGPAIGLYMMALNGGATVGALVSVPLAEVLGWSAALAVWAGPALVALAVWAPVAWGSRSPAHVPPARPSPSRHSPANRARGGEELPEIDGIWRNLPWRNSTAWWISLYLGLQSFCYYGFLTWLAPFYRKLGWPASRAGLLLSVCLGVGVITSLAFPMVAHRQRDRRPVFWLAAACATAATLVLLVAPRSLPWVNACVLGVAVGGLFPLGVMLLIDHTASPEAAARLSAMAFFVTYLFGAAGPLLLGGLRDASGGYTLGWMVVLAAELGVSAVVSQFTPTRRMRSLVSADRPDDGHAKLPVDGH